MGEMLSDNYLCDCVAAQNSDDFYGFDRVDGHDKAKLMLESIVVDAEHDELLQLDSGRVVAFTGPLGNGKHLMAEAFGQEVARLGTVMYQINCEEFKFFNESFAECLGQFLREMESMMKCNPERAYYIYLENITAIMKKKVSSLLVNTVRKWSKAGLNYYLVMTAESIGELPKELDAYLWEVKLDLPTMDDRGAYFETNLLQDVFFQKIEVTSQTDPTENFLPKILSYTNGFTYGDLKKLVMMAKAEYRAVTLKNFSIEYGDDPMADVAQSPEQLFVYIRDKVFEDDANLEAGLSHHSYYEFSMFEKLIQRIQESKKARTEAEEKKKKVSLQGPGIDPSIIAALVAGNNSGGGNMGFGGLSTGLGQGGGMRVSKDSENQVDIDLFESAVNEAQKDETDPEMIALQGKTATQSQTPVVDPLSGDPDFD